MKKVFSRILLAVRVASKIAGSFKSYIEIVYIIVFSYVDREKTLPRRLLILTMPSLFGLQSANRNQKEVSLKIRINSKDYDISFSLEHFQEIWSIASVLIEVLYHETYQHIYLQYPGLIVDAGANVGVATLYFHSIYPKAKYICYEPSKSTFDILKRNMLRNNVNCSVQNLALYSHDTLISFDDNKPSMSRMISDNEKNHTAIVNQIQAVSLESDLLKKGMGSLQIDLLKIDVEGAEVKVLQGVKQIKSQIKYIVGEVHSEQLSEQVASWLSSNEFSFTFRNEHFYAKNKL